MEHTNTDQGSALRLHKRSSPPTTELFSDYEVERMSPGQYTPPPLPFQSDSPPKSYLHYHHDDEHNFLRNDFIYDEYVYTKIQSNQIRLLLLSRGRPGEAVHCSLKAMEYSRLESTQYVYQALSYAWGQDSPSKEIFLQDIIVPAEHLSREEIYELASRQAVPRRFHVRSNLHNALTQLRSDSQDLWLWIDALCINQGDVTEKSHQIPKMLDIYSNALNVCIWVGLSGLSEDGHRGMDFIPSILNLKLLDRMTAQDVPDEKIARSWVTFANILRRPWFRRRWVIQEVAASRNASVQCGSRSINWIDFADAVQLFMRKIELIRAIYDRTELSKEDPDALSHIESAGATAIVNATNNVLRRGPSGGVLDRIWNIEALVMKFLNFETSDPRDTIFALLSLASDGHLMNDQKVCSKTGGTLAPDYSKPAVQTYIEFMQHCTTSSGSLDMICRYWALPVVDRHLYARRDLPFEAYQKPTESLEAGNCTLPSWIGLVRDSPFGAPSRLSGRLNGESLVGNPGKSSYNASRGRAPKTHFGMSISTDDSGSITHLDIQSEDSPPLENPTGIGLAMASSRSDQTEPFQASYPALSPLDTEKPQPHVCSICHRSYSRSEHLKRHKIVHTRDKPFECPVCTRCFVRRDLLLRHQQTAHSIGLSKQKAVAKDEAADGLESQGDSEEEASLHNLTSYTSPTSADDEGFRALEDWRRNKRLRTPKALFTGTLYAKGLLLSRILRVSSRVVDGTISDDCLAMAGWRAGSDVNNIPDCLWRTLVADRAADGSSAPFWYRRACMYCLHKASPDGDLNTSKLLANRSLPDTVLEYLRRVQSIVWSRKFFACREPADKSKRPFGLGSRNIQEDDIVCILFGCSVPVVLRFSETTRDYKFIGECYVHGNMDGELLAGMDEEKILESTVEFNIR
jgi:hypothetical protein